jgi:hypothetical protein
MTFDTYIYQQLEASSAVIVLWSKDSVHSDYVKEEADYAKKHGVLVPLRIDETALPFGFTRLQATDIAGWEGVGGDPQWQIVVNSIEAILGHKSASRSAARELLPVQHPGDPPQGQRLQVNVAATLATAIVLIMLVGLVLGLAMHLISG